MKKYIWLVVIALFVSIFVVVLNIYDDGGLQEPEYVPTDEEIQLMAEARPIIEEFNNVYVAKSQDEFESIVTNISTDPENAIAGLQEVYDGATEFGYTAINVEFSDEKIEELAEDKSSFLYKARATITLINETGYEEEYSHQAEYNFKKMDDGTFKIESITTKELQNMKTN